MFQQFKNIDTAFKHIRLFSLFLIAACVALCSYTIYKSYDIVTETQARIYILANGKALEAFSAERKDNIPVEGRDHVKMFHYYFFTLHPDDKVIQSNIQKALYLADGSALPRAGRTPGWTEHPLRRAGRRQASSRRPTPVVSARRRS